MAGSGLSGAMAVARREVRARAFAAGNAGACKGLIT